MRGYYVYRKGDVATSQCVLQEVMKEVGWRKIGALSAKLYLLSMTLLTTGCFTATVFSMSLLEPENHSCRIASGKGAVHAQKRRTFLSILQ